MREMKIDAAAGPWSGEILRLLESGGGRDQRREVDALIQSFNSWAFKREQPDSLEKLRLAAGTAIERNAPLGFVLYWGRGPRAEVASPERQCLDYLSSLTRRVESQHRPGADLTVICTDTHAKLNGHPPVSTQRYFAEVEREAAERGFRTSFLCDLVARAENRIDPTRAFEPPSPDFLRRLMASAAKWYAGGSSIEEGARLYYHANMIEKQAVEAAFPHAIFVTFNGSALRLLFPDNMPIFFMYSVRRGVAVKPWFMEAEPDEPAERRAREPVR